MHIASLNINTPNKETAGRMDWVDSLRALAAISVILLHVAAEVVVKYSKIPADQWWIAHIYDSLTRFRVAIFFMLTGALLLNKTYSIREFLRKRASRIIWPFLFWSVVYITYQLYNKHLVGKPITAQYVYDFSLIKLRVGAEHHLWYIYAITGIYLFIPIFSQWTVKSKQNALHYFLLMWMIGIILAHPLLQNYSTRFDLSYFSGNLGYVLLGYYLSERFHQPKIIQFSFWIFVVGVLLTIFGTYHFTLKHHAFYGNLYGYLTPNVVMASIGFFLMFRYQINVSKYLQPVFSFIGRNSYGIYLAHVLMLQLLQRNQINGMLYHPAIGIPLTTLACLLMSLGITWVIGKIPGGKYIAGN